MDLLKQDKQTTPQQTEHPKSLQRLQGLWRRLLLSEYFVLYLAVLYFLILWPFIPDIATLNNLSNLSSNMAPLLIVAIGQTVVLLVAGIDLSQTAVMGLSSVLGSMCMTTVLNPALFSKSPFWGIFLSAHGSPMSGSPLAFLIAILVMLLIGSLVGLLNGIAIAQFRMPPFMVTLVTMTFFQALAIWCTKSENIFHLPAPFVAIANGSLFSIQYIILIAIVVAVVMHLLLSRTVFGHWLYAIGTNTRTALVSGIPTRRTVILAYVISGFCAAGASILYTAQLATGSPTLGQNLLLDVIGATVVGGTSLFGGKGKVLWTVFGVLFFVLLDNSLDLLNLSYYTVTAVKGTVIVVAAFLNVTRVRFLERQ